MSRWVVAPLFSPLALGCASGGPSSGSSPREQPGSFCPPALSGGPHVEWQPPEGPRPELLREGADLGHGSILKSDIRDAIARDLHGIKLCYECAWTRTDPRPGTVFMPRFAIGPDGAVAALEIYRTDFDARTTACMKDVIRGLRFPAPDGDGYVIVVYPFRFSVAAAPR